MCGGTAHAKSKSVTIIEKTEYYSITGKSAAEFAVSMGRKGPYSRQHRRRAWATAYRDLTYQLVQQKLKQSCRITDAKIKLSITYTLPKLTQEKAVPSKELAKWRRMLDLLIRHERTHGLYYKQMAEKVHRSLVRMKPQSNCTSQKQSAKALVKKLSQENKLLNDRFDERDHKNYRQMQRIYGGS